MKDCVICNFPVDTAEDPPTENWKYSKKIDGVICEICDESCYKLCPKCEDRLIENYEGILENYVFIEDMCDGCKK